MNFIPHTKEESLQIIKDLVARFKQNEKSYTSVIYDESNTRTDFIDKFFEALNWDVRNDNGFAERFREVVREDKVVINGKQKPLIIHSDLADKKFSLWKQKSHL